MRQRRQPAVKPDADLIERASSFGSVVLIEAPAGYGKSVLCDGLFAAVEDAVLLTSIGELERYLRRPSNDLARNLLVDVHGIDVTHVRGLVDSGPESLCLAGRVIGSAIRRELLRFDTLEIGVLELALERSEIGGLVGSQDSELIDYLYDVTLGWPAAVSTLAETLAGQDGVAAGSSGYSVLARSSAISDLVQRTLTNLPEEVRRHLGLFGVLPRLPGGALDAVAWPGFVPDAVRQGVPLVRRADGWFELPPLFRSHLERDVFRAGSVSHVAVPLARSGGLIPALRLLVSAGEADEARTLLHGAAPHEIDGADQDSLIGIVGLLDPDRADKQLGLVEARARENLGQLELQSNLLNTMASSPSGAGVIEVDLKLEQLRALALRGASVPEDELAALRSGGLTARQEVAVRELGGLVGAQSEDPSVVASAADLLLEVAEQWQLIGEEGRAASVLRTVSAGALGHLGRHGAAITALRRARSLAWNQLYQRALTSVLLCRTAALAGRAQLFEATIAEAESLARALELPWLMTYVRWSQMQHASVAGAASARVAQLAAEAERSLGGLRSHSTGVVFKSEAASALAVVGESELARSFIEHARLRRDEAPVEVLLAEVVVAARAGDHDALGRAVQEAREDHRVPPDRLWRVDLEVELAEPAGLAASADRSAAEAASGLGLAELVEGLGRGAAGGPELQVSLLGGFGLSRGGRPISMSAGREVALVKLLGVEGGRAAIPRLLDGIWPDVDEAVARRRLKNVLNRARSTLGEGALVRDSHAVAFGPGVELDTRQFDEAVREALSAPSTASTKATAAIRALNMYKGLLLPDDLYADWIRDRRVALVASALAMWDIVAQQVEPRPAVSWLLDLLLRIDPTDEARLVQIADRSLSQNDRGTGRRALEAARRATEDLELPTSQELDLAWRRFSESTQ